MTVRGDVDQADGNKVVYGDEVQGDKVTVGRIDGGTVAIGPGSHATTVIQRIFSPTEAQELQQRQVMLQRVKSYWIEGLLERSLYGQVLVDLGLEYKPQAVGSPWEMMVQEIQEAARVAPAGTPIAFIFDEQDGQLLILGAPGSGKTTLLLNLARTLIERAEQDETHPIPVVFNLASWAQQRRPLRDWLVDELNVRYQVPKRLGQAWIQKDLILPLLDGLDEVAQEHRPACVAAINQFRSAYGLTSMAVCSRVADYVELRTKLNLRGAVVLRPLKAEQIDDYLAELGEPVAGLRTLLQDDPELQELAQTPLMLSILILTYEGRPAPAKATRASPEERRSAVLAAYVERMFVRRGVDPRFSRTNAVRWLSWLARGMQENSTSMFALEQLQPGWLTVRSERRTYMLLSRLIAAGPLGLVVLGIVTFLQLDNGAPPDLVFITVVVASLGCAVGALASGLSEYRRYEGASRVLIPAPLTDHRTIRLTLRLVVAVAAAIMLVVGAPLSLLAVVGALSEGKGLATGLTDAAWALVFTAVVALLYSVLIGLFLGLRGKHRGYASDIQTIEALRVSKRGALLGGFMGAILGALLVLPAVAMPEWTQLWPYYVARYGALGALIGGLVARRPEVAVRPNKRMRHVLRRAALLGILPAIVFAVYGGPIAGWGYGIWSGSVIGGLLFMWFGGFDALEHYVLRSLLALKGHAPWRYSSFLNFATERIFLERIGPSYVFVHRLLLEHFAHNMGDAR